MIYLHFNKGGDFLSYRARVIKRRKMKDGSTFVESYSADSYLFISIISSIFSFFFKAIWFIIKLPFIPIYLPIKKLGWKGTFISILVLIIYLLAIVYLSATYGTNIANGVV